MSEPAKPCPLIDATAVRTLAMARMLPRLPMRSTVHPKSRATPRRSGNARSKPSHPAQPRLNTRLHLLLASAAMLLLMLAAYANSLTNGFVWDDHQQILLNPAVHPGAPLTPLFTADVRFASHSQTVQNTVYRPLQMFTYRILFGVFGADATAFHGCSLLFATACVLAAFLVFWRLTRRLPLAFAAAALFALNPIHTEAVDWIAALPELGFSLFALLSFALFLATRGPSGKPQRLSTTAALSWLSFAIAMFWKETALVFPLLIAAYVLLSEPGIATSRRLHSALYASAPYWIILAAFLSLRIYLLGAFKSGTRDWALTASQLALNALLLMESYWARLALPIRLNAYYSFSPLRSFTEARAILTILIALAAVAAIVVLLRRRAANPSTASSTPNDFALGLFAAFWVFLTLLPAMDLAALGRNPFTERYLYLPSAGFCLLVVILASAALKHLPPSRQKAVGSSILALVLLGFLVETIQHNAVWKDNETLFSQAVTLSPEAPFPHNMLAAAEDANPTQAEQQYLQAASLATQQSPPDRLDAVTAYRGLAWIYADRAQYPQALQTLDQATAIDPVDADTDGEKGLILARAGDGANAAPFLERALIAEPENENVLSALGIVTRDDQHDPAKAIALFEKAIAAHSGDDDFAASQHNNLGAAFGDDGNLLAATAQFREAVRILPSDPEFHVNLASALAAQGNFAEARTEAQAALQIDPNYPPAQDLLRQILAQPTAPHPGLVP